MKRIKTGGRTPGAKNKVSAPMRVLLSDFLSAEWANVQTAFSKLDPVQKVQAFSRLLPFVTPSYSAIDFSLRNMSEADLQLVLERVKNEINEEEDEQN